MMKQYLNKIIQGNAKLDNIQPNLFDMRVENKKNEQAQDLKSKPACKVSAQDKEDLFTYWVRVCQMGPPAPKFTSSRRKLLNQRLNEGYTMDDLARAITGCSRNTHNRGENERGTKYMNWSLILRNVEKVDYFISCYHDQEKRGVK